MIFVPNEGMTTSRKSEILFSILLSITIANRLSYSGRNQIKYVFLAQIHYPTHEEYINCLMSVCQSRGTAEPLIYISFVAPVQKCNLFTKLLKSSQSS